MFLSPEKHYVFVVSFQMIQRRIWVASSSSAPSRPSLQLLSPYCLINRGDSQWIHSCSPPTDPLMKGHLCPCTCGEIHQHTGVFIAGQSHQPIKQNCSSTFSGSAVSGDRWFAPGLESVVEQHLPWTLKSYKALYGSPEDVWGIFWVMLVVQVASN